MTVKITNKSRSLLILHDKEGQAITLAPGEGDEATSFCLKHPVHKALKASGEITVEEIEGDPADEGAEAPAGEETLASWSKAPESYDIGGKTVAAETVLMLAAQKAEADVATWNALKVAERKDFVEAALAQLQAEAEAEAQVAKDEGEGGGE